MKHLQERNRANVRDTRPVRNYKETRPFQNRADTRPTPYVRKSLSKHDSTCTICDPAFCTYPEHVCHNGPNAKLLQSSEQFCEGLFHIFPAPEFGLEVHGCINGSTQDNCRPQSLVLVVQFGDILARYTNCRRKHAEQFMIGDPILRKAIEECVSDQTLTMFMKFQPCHHSGGNARVCPEGYRDDTRSCTLLVCQFYETVLKPRNIKLVVKCSSIYKANWEFCKREDDIKATALALEGVRKLISSGIDLQCVQPHDWVFLASLADGIDYLHLFSPARLSTDQGIAKFFDAQKNALE